MAEDLETKASSIDGGLDQQESSGSDNLPPLLTITGPGQINQNPFDDLGQNPPSSVNSPPPPPPSGPSNITQGEASNSYIAEDNENEPSTIDGDLDQQESSGTEVENIVPVTSKTYNSSRPSGITQGEGADLDIAQDYETMPSSIDGGLDQQVEHRSSDITCLEEKNDDNLEPLDRCQVGGCCCVYAVLNCIRLFLQQQNDNSVPSLQDPISCCLSNGDTNKGWTIEDLLDYILVYGLPVEGGYPFTGDNDRCLVHKPRLNQGSIDRPIHISGYKAYKVDKKNGVRDLRDLIQTHGAVVVTIYVGPEFGHEFCHPDLDDDGLFVEVRTAADEASHIFGHAILLTDHKEIKGRGCWLARNWYGPGWGDNGYIKIDDKFTYMFDDFGCPIGVSAATTAAPQAKLDEVESAPDAWLEDFSSMVAMFD